LQQQDGKLLYNRKEGDKVENKNKNRFKTILPFDHTRVQLRGRLDIGCDYINANYIKSEDLFGKSYIATQGPLQTTIDDFWRMVWQESSKIILMITHEVEKGRPKCCKYWPEVNEIITYDCIKIKCRDKIQYDDYLLRELVISHVKHVSF
jgi:tyrosine-protein phosphatase non-receptor type 11